MAFYNNEIEYNNFLIKHNITPNEFDFCWKLYNHKIKNTSLGSIYKIFNELKVDNNKNESKYIDTQSINYLLKINFIKLEINTKSEFPDIYEVTDNFIKTLYIDTNIAFEELIFVYPKFIYVNNVEFNAINIDFDEALRLYNKKIGFSKIKHETIIKELKSQINKQLITCGLDKWLKSEMWRLESIKQISNSNFV